MREINAGEPASSSNGSMEQIPIRSLNILEENGVGPSGFGRPRPALEDQQVAERALYHVHDLILLYGNTSFFRDPFTTTA